MPAIVRVKRRIDEEPLSAFVLNGKKRRRLAEGEVADNGADGESASALEGKDEISTILKFAGTITKQDNVATTQLARLTKEEAKELVQQKMRKPTNHTERARQEMRQSMHEQRFRVVNCLRTGATNTDEDGNALINNENNANATSKPVTIVDIEKQSKVTSAAATTATAATTTTPIAQDEQLQQQQQLQQVQPSDSDTGYVYDLYIPENEQQAEYVDLMDDNYLSVRAFDNLVYDERYNNESDDDEYDSEDSNQENHIANDYPDEQSGSDDQYEDFDDEREIRHGIRNFILDDDDDDVVDLSSSDDEDVNVYQDPYVHTVDANEESFVEDIDSCDVERYGIAYARYKKRALKKLYGDNNGDDDDDDDDQSEENDSDNEHYHSASENDDCYKP